jgi:hypothetical protein
LWRKRIANSATSRPKQMLVEFIMMLLDVFLDDAGDFKLQSDVVLVFVNVRRRCEAGGCQRLLRPLRAIRLTEKAAHSVYTVLHSGELTERFPTDQ